MRDYLVQHFKLDDTRIKTFGGGKSQNTPEGGEVDVVVYPSGKTDPETKAAPGRLRQGSK